VTCNQPIVEPRATNGFAAGSFLCLLVSLAVWRIASLPWNHKLQLNPLMLGIVAGTIFGNMTSPAFLSWIYPGILFSQQKLLRLGIILYGLRVTIQDLFHLGPRALVLDLVVITSVLLLGYKFGTQVLKLDPDTALLVSIGSGICGAAAVLAADRVIESESQKVGIAVATVTIFGTLSMFLYPMLYPLAGLTERQFGVYTGATVHEVAQVVAAGRAVSGVVGDTAVVTKMLRVLLLAPVLFIMGRLRGKAAKGESNHISFPWFVVWFLSVIVIQSLNVVPARVHSDLIDCDTVLLGGSMFALGATTRWSRLMRAGSRPLLLGATLFVCLVGGGYLLTVLIVK
jgi:uncharacterized integral membrane protein (TIGR00698 family)